MNLARTNSSMSGWNDFVDGTLKPIYNGGMDIKREIVGDVNGVYQWGKGTVSGVGNLASHTVDNATKLEDALTGALQGIGSIFNTPYLLYGGIAVVAVIVLTKK